MPPPDLVPELLKPQAYGARLGAGGVHRVELIQTHISWLFLTETRVYKVKRPVNLGFLDFSTLDLREHFVREELRLNQRLSPSMYLGVVAIVRSPSGQLQVIAEEDLQREGNDAQGVVEWALEMVRLPAERMLSSLLERGEIDNQGLGELAQILVRFHRTVPTGPGVDRYGTPPAIEALVRQNFEQLRPFVLGENPGGILSQALLTFLESCALTFLREESRRLEQRVRAGRIREGHGDLHSGNICFAPEGIQIYDCIEFSPAFRSGDVAGELAFLAMDLDYRGFTGFGRFLVHRYGELAQDEGLLALIPFYKTYRAVVRAKVACLTSTSAGLDDGRRETLRREAQGYLHLAAAYNLPHMLILMCGLPASGKSTIARRIARPLHAAVLRSDVRRKLLAGRNPSVHAQEDWGSGLYAPDSTQRTYAALLAQARELLLAGRSVIVDATFSQRDLRARFLEMANAMGVPALVVHVSATEAVTRARLERRRADKQEVSDADLGVYLSARERFEPPTEVSAAHLVEVISDDGANPEAPAADLIERVLSSYSAS